MFLLQNGLGKKIKAMATLLLFLIKKEQGTILSKIALYFVNGVSCFCFAVDKCKQPDFEPS